MTGQPAVDRVTQEEFSQDAHLCLSDMSVTLMAASASHPLTLAESRATVRSAVYILLIYTEMSST